MMELRQADRWIVYSNNSGAKNSAFGALAPTAGNSR